jgi:hypothetical protein
MSILCLVLADMATPRRAAPPGTLALSFMDPQSGLFKKVRGSHVKITGNQIHASSMIDSSCKKDSDPEITRFVLFERLCTLEQPKLGPQARPASEQSFR